MMKLGYLVPKDGDGQRASGGGAWDPGFVVMNPQTNNIVNIVPFKPLWWPETDPITGNPVISSAMI